MFIPILLTIFCYVTTALSALLGPCNKGDFECVMKSLNNVRATVYSGIPSLSVESSDPLFQEIVEANLSILKLKLINSTVTGFKDCSIENVNLNLPALKMSYDMECLNFVMIGTYEISGKLIVMPVEGKGPYKLVTGKYSIPTELELQLANGKDGKKFVNIKNFNIKPEALGPMTFDFKNLFNGQKDLSDAVHKFAHENWKEVASLVQEPILKKNLKKIYSNYNKFLKTQPLDEIYLN